MNNQVKFSFDRETTRKILKSLWIAAIAPAVVVFLQQLGDIHFHSENPVIDVMLVYAVPVLINAAIEWVKGKDKWE